jgi:hypothetical protein
LRSDDIDIRQAQCKVVGASAIRLSAGYAGARSKRILNFFVSDSRMRICDNEVYVTMVLLLRGFVGNADVLEKGN